MDSFIKTYRIVDSFDGSTIPIDSLDYAFSDIKLVLNNCRINKYINAIELFGSFHYSPFRRNIWGCGKKKKEQNPVKQYSSIAAGGVSLTSTLHTPGEV